MSKSFEGKIKLSSYSELVGDTGGEIIEVNLSELHEFAGHPFRVVDDERMQEMVESVQKHGVLVPGIVRHRKEGGYEIISGHRRRRACELAGLLTMPVVVKEYSEDQATVVMVDANIQRSDCRGKREDSATILVAVSIDRRIDGPGGSTENYLCVWD